MATIQAKTDGKKIISYKFKTCVGRDKDGKQVFRCHTWYPPADLPKIKCKKEAQKEAIIWEEEAKEAFLREQEAKAVADVPVSYTFDKLFKVDVEIDMQLVIPVHLYPADKGAYDHRIGRSAQLGILMQPEQRQSYLPAV